MKTVHGAVSMVQMALAELSAQEGRRPRQRAQGGDQVSNLMTVLCADSDVQPVITTGTLSNG